MLLYSPSSSSFHAQPSLHAWRRFSSFRIVKPAIILLLAGVCTPCTDALQLRASPHLLSFSTSSSFSSSTSPPATSHRPAAALYSSVGSSSNDSMTAAALPLTVKGTAHADTYLASSPAIPTKSSVSRTPRTSTTGDISFSRALNSPSATAYNAAAAAGEGFAAAAAAAPEKFSSAAAVPASDVVTASRAATKLAFVNNAPLSSSRACRHHLIGRGRQETRSSYQQLSREKYAAAAALSDNKHPLQTSWLHAPILQQQRLAAAPPPPLAPGGAVVEGDRVNGKSVRDWTVERTIYQALHMALAEEMQRDPSVCVMGEDVGHYGGSYKVTKDLHAVFGNLRVMDTPICENTFTGMAIGAAMNGLRPVVEGMNMGFLLLAFNQISNNAGMVRYTSGGGFDVPVVIRGPGGVGKQLGPEHSQRIEAYLMAVPGLKMVACSTPYNARGLLKSAIREDNPVVFFEHVLTYNMKEEIPLLPYTLPLDRAEVVREGNDVTLLAYGKLRYVALEAAKQLDSLGVSTEILDLISLKPLDMDSVCKSLRKTGRCIILDESSKTGGIGGEILSQVVENCADELLRPPVRLATKDIPTPYARELEDATIVTPADVVNAALWMVSSRSQPTVGRHLA